MAKKPVKIEVEEDRGDELVPEDEKDNPVPKSSCALWSIFLVLFVLLAAIVGSLLYLKIHKFSLNAPEVNLNINSAQQAPISGENVTVKLTEEQIQDALNANDANFPLKKATIKVNTDKVVLSGKTSNNFWGVSVEVGLVPKVESGKVKFDITEIKSAGLTAPKSISDTVNQNLGQYLDGLSALAGSIEVSQVELNPGYVIIEGRQK